jgi:hypothetical protein
MHSPWYLTNSVITGEPPQFVEVQVNQQTLLNQSVFVGDIGHGMHPVNLQLGSVEVGPNDSLALNYFFRILYP